MKHYLVRKEPGKARLHDAAMSVEPSEEAKALAEQLVQTIAKASSRIFKPVVMLVQTQGYRALGYKKPQPCLRARIPEFSNSYICRLLKATDLYLKLDHQLHALDYVSEPAIRPLQALTESEAKYVWKALLKQYPKQKITPKYVKKMIARHGFTPMKAPEKKATVAVDPKLKNAIPFLAKRIANKFILPHVQSPEQWVALVKLIHQQLLTSCPLSKPGEKA